MQNLENNDVKVSVIILTFNHEKFINQALCSATKFLRNSDSENEKK